MFDTFKPDYKGKFGRSLLILSVLAIALILPFVLLKSVLIYVIWLMVLVTESALIFYQKVFDEKRKALPHVLFLIFNYLLLAGLSYLVFVYYF